MDINKLTSKIISAAIEVHKALGPGLLFRCLLLLSGVLVPVKPENYLTGVNGKQ
jgi:hypothetical protein